MKVVNYDCVNGCELLVGKIISRCYALGAPKCYGYQDIVLLLFAIACVMTGETMSAQTIDTSSVLCKPATLVVAKLLS